MAPRNAGAFRAERCTHTNSKYFGVGQIARDQVIDYAARTGETIAAAEKRLAPNLGYDPPAAG